VIPHRQRTATVGLYSHCIISRNISNSSQLARWGIRTAYLQSAWALRTQRHAAVWRSADCAGTLLLFLRFKSLRSPFLYFSLLFYADIFEFIYFNRDLWVFL